jgi:hypothetical protein
MWGHCFHKLPPYRCLDVLCTLASASRSCFAHMVLPDRHAPCLLLSRRPRRMWCGRSGEWRDLSESPVQLHGHVCAHFVHTPHPNLLGYMIAARSTHCDTWCTPCRPLLPSTAPLQTEHTAGHKLMHSTQTRLHLQNMPAARLRKESPWKHSVCSASSLCMGTMDDGSEGAGLASWHESSVYLPLYLAARCAHSISSLTTSIPMFRQVPCTTFMAASTVVALRSGSFVVAISLS